METQQEVSEIPQSQPQQNKIPYELVALRTYSVLYGDMGWILDNLTGKQRTSIKEFLYQKQEKRCCICGGYFWCLGDAHLDHDHKNGQIRGLLCSKCNTGLGFFRDNPTYLRRAIDYLYEYDKETIKKQEKIPRLLKTVYDGLQSTDRIQKENRTAQS